MLNKYDSKKLWWNLFLLFGFIDVIVSIVGVVVSSMLIHKTRQHQWILAIISFLIPIMAFIFFLWTVVTQRPTNQNVKQTYIIVVIAIMASVLLQLIIVSRLSIIIGKIVVFTGIACGAISVMGFMASKDIMLYPKPKSTNPRHNYSRTAT